MQTNECVCARATTEIHSHQCFFNSLTDDAEKRVVSPFLKEQIELQFESIEQLKKRVRTAPPPPPPPPPSAALTERTTAGVPRDGALRRRRLDLVARH